MSSTLVGDASIINCSNCTIIEDKIKKSIKKIQKLRKGITKLSADLAICQHQHGGNGNGNDGQQQQSSSLLKRTNESTTAVAVIKTEPLSLLRLKLEQGITVTPPSTSTIKLEPHDEEDNSGTESEPGQRRAPILIQPDGVETTQILLERHGLPLTCSDVLRLSDKGFLNSQIIDFWLKDLYSKLSEVDRSRTHIFPTSFYKRLTTINKRPSWEQNSSLSLSQRRHLRVQRYTRRVDIFSKDFVIVPIIEDKHWYLALICYPGLDGVYSMEDSTKLPYQNIDYTVKHNGKHRKVVITSKIEDSDTRRRASEPFDGLERPNVKQPCILLFESLTTENNHPKLYANLRNYLEVEYFEKRNVRPAFDKLNMPGFQPVVVPQQGSTFDSGIFLLSFVEAFFTKPIKNYWLPLPHLHDWLHPSIVEMKRREIYDAIVELVKTEEPGNLTYLPTLKDDEEEEER